MHCKFKWRAPLLLAPSRHLSLSRTNWISLKASSRCLHQLNFKFPTRKCASLKQADPRCLVRSRKIIFHLAASPALTHSWPGHPCTKRNMAHKKHYNLLWTADRSVPEEQIYGKLVRIIHGWERLGHELHVSYIYTNFTRNSNHNFSISLYHEWFPSGARRSVFIATLSGGRHQLRKIINACLRRTTRNFQFSALCARGWVDVTWKSCDWHRGSCSGSLLNILVCRRQLFPATKSDARRIIQIGFLFLI